MQCGWIRTWNYRAKLVARYHASKIQNVIFLTGEPGMTKDGSMQHVSKTVESMAGVMGN